jgi:hypothetical protein
MNQKNKKGKLRTTRVLSEAGLECFDWEIALI